MNKDVMIIDNTSKNLSLNESASVLVGKKPKIILEGIFTQFNRVNRNNRIYTNESFIPHLNEMIERKNSLGVVFGEFDHPDVFDISMKNLSHTVESAYYNQADDSVYGSIRLLNTHYGKEAQSIIEDELPLFVSSRAAGVTESNGHVSLRKLFTYDIVADPGFAAARMSSKSMNESLGYGSNTDTMIIDWSDSSVNKLFENNSNEQVTKMMMVEFQDYMKNTVANLELKIKEAIKNNENPENVANLVARHESAEYTFEQLNTYLNFVKESFGILVKKQDNLETAFEKISNIDLLNTKVEKLEKQLESTQNFINYVARKTKNSIAFTENVANESNNEINTLKESINENKNYFDKITEKLSNKLGSSIKYLEHNANILSTVNDKLNITSAFAEYVAENTKQSKSAIADNIMFTDSLSEHTEGNIEYLNYLENVVEKLSNHSDKVTEKLNSLLSAKNVNESTEETTIELLPMVSEIINNEVNSKYSLVKEDNEEEQENSEIPADQSDEPEGTEPEGTEPEGDLDDQDELGEGEGEGEATEPEGDESEGDEPAEDATVNTPIEISEITPDVVSTEDLPGVELEPAVDMPLTDDSNLTSQLDAEVNVNDDTVTVDSNNGETVITLGDDKVVKIVGTEDTGTIVDVDGDGNVTVKLSGTDELVSKSSNEIEELEAPMETSNLMESVKKLITEAKKREASKVEVPNFFKFMNENQIESFKTLDFNKQEEVKLFMEDKDYFSNEDVTKLLYYAIEAKPKTLNEKIIENIPEDIKPLWENLNESIQQSVLASSAWFPIKNELSIEHFWRTRNLEKYNANLNESVSSEPAASIVFPEDVQFTDSEIEKFFNRINNL